jgi:hypothetical protein
MDEQRADVISTDDDQVLELLRVVILGVLVLGIVGTVTELLLLEHDEADKPLQFVPLSLIAAGVAAIIWHLARPGPASLNTLQVVMVLYVLSSFIGFLAHFNGSAEFVHDLNPEASTWEILEKALHAKAPPLLAPGMMMQLGLLGLAYVYSDFRYRERAWRILKAVRIPLPAEEPSFEVAMPAGVERLLNPRVPLGKRVSRVARFLIIFCIGVVATLAWQSLGWLAPPAAPDIQRIALPPDQEDLKAISFGLAGMRQRVDEIAAQFVAGQEQTTRDITELHAAEQEILENILKLHATEQEILENVLKGHATEQISAPPPRPAAAPVRKPAPLTPAPR